MKKIKQLIEFIQNLKYTGWSFLFAWYDLWIGMYFDKKKNWLYILPVPMLGVIIKFENQNDLADKALRLYYSLSKEQLEIIYEKHHNNNHGTKES